MNELHSARYQASRPWARRLGQLFGQSSSRDDACSQGAQLVQRELAQLATLYPLNDTQRETEFVLAEAWGLFVRDGRRVFALAPSLAQALQHSHPVAALPASMALPEGTFLLALPGGAGAYVTHEAATQRLDILLLTPDFAPADVPWQQRMEAALTLGVNYPETVAVPDSPALASWKPWLQGLFATLALLTQPRLVLSTQWWPQPPAATLHALAHAAPRERQKLRASLLKAGAQPVQLAAWPALAVPAEPLRAGYWRNQASAQGHRLVWVPPRPQTGKD